MSGDNDGLSSDEMLKLLFKSYMNFGSSSHDKEFLKKPFLRTLPTYLETK